MFFQPQCMQKQAYGHFKIVDIPKCPSQGGALLTLIVSNTVKILIIDYVQIITTEVQQNYTILKYRTVIDVQYSFRYKNKSSDKS